MEDATVLDYRNTSRGALTDEFGADTPLGEIDEDRIERYRNKMLSGVLAQRKVGVPEEKQRPLSRRSAQKRLVMLGAIFKRAKRLKWITADPTTEVEPITLKPSGDFNVRPSSRSRPSHLGPESGPRCTGPRSWVAACTGLRTGELRALRWRDIDFTAASIYVRSNRPVGGEEKAPKSGKVRSVPLMDDAARALDGLSQRENFTAPDDRVFPNDVGEILGDDALRDALYAAMEAAGIDRKGFPAKGGFTFHDLRHTFGTLAVRVWPLSDVQAYMGHADIQTTMRYVHHTPKTGAAREFTEAIERMKAAAEATPAMPPLEASQSG